MTARTRGPAELLLLSNGVSLHLAPFEGNERDLLVNAINDNSNRPIVVRLMGSAKLTVAKSQVVGLIEEETIDE